MVVEDENDGEEDPHQKELDDNSIPVPSLSELIDAEGTIENENAFQTEDKVDFVDLTSHDDALDDLSSYDEEIIVEESPEWIEKSSERISQLSKSPPPRAGLKKQMKRYCALCPKSYCSKYRLKEHLALKHGLSIEKKTMTRFRGTNEKHGCPTCGKQFVSQGHFIAHLRTHDPTPFPCSACDEAFPTLRGRQDHEFKCVQFVAVQRSACASIEGEE